MADGTTDTLLNETEGHVEVLLGNDAIVRGALEAGVGFAAGYPGTPSSEVTDSFARVSKAAGVVFEYSVNEKIALEMAFAACLAGTRAICAMKHLGLMYAGDPLSTIPYVGTVGGLVIVSAGDPSCRTSPNEQDQRYLGPMLHIPMLDPSTPAEAHRMARFAFELSERSKLPVVLRPTTRVCHSRAPIRYGPRSRPVVHGFVRDPKRFVPIPVNARKLRLEVNERLETARALITGTDFVRSEGSGELAVVASGAPAGACADLLVETGLAGDLKLVTVGGVYPLAEDKLVAALEGVRRALVVEELSPFLEDSVRSLASRKGLGVEVLGKRTGHLPVEFELEPAQIQRAIHEGLGVGPQPRKPRPTEPVPPRPPTLCPGCPHRASQFAARTVFGEDTLYFNDIGCYTLGYGPPLNTADALLCMGAGFSLAAGVSRVTGQRTVGLLGDSTFFHSGMPALLNAIKEEIDMVAVILDNQVTAMTGYQESPGVEFLDGDPTRTVSIEGLVRALGAGHVEVVDPNDLPATILAFERARDASGVSVVICKRPCPGFVARETHRAYKTGTYEVDPDACRTCGREAGGRRCGLEPCDSYQRHMTRSRSLELAAGETDRPREAPCSLRCPVGLCIQGFIGHIAAGRYEQAYELILDQLPLPDSVCRVCHRPCEEVCVRAELDDPVAVNDLKRFVMDWAADAGLAFEPDTQPASGQRVSIVGAGPSGLAAAWELAMRGHQVTVLDRDQAPGGLLAQGIPGYRLPAEALARDLVRLEALGVRFEGGRELGRDFSLDDLLADGAEAIYLATGAQRAFRLDLPGQAEPDRPEVIDGLAFLREVNAGQPPAAVSRVVVIGGGNAAIDAARAALRLGAEQVTIAYRRRRDEMPAIAEEIAAAEQEGVRVLTQLAPVRLEPGEVVLARTAPGPPDASGRCRPVPVAGSEQSLGADRVISAIGQAPDSAGWLTSEMTCGPDGALLSAEGSRRTGSPKIYAGGDLTADPRTVVNAIAAGRQAGWEIDRALRGADADQRRPPPPIHPDPPGRAGVARADRLGRQRPAELATADRVAGFDEVVATLDPLTARREAGRCLVCGLCGLCRACLDLFGCPAFYMDGDRIRIDPELCMGCGVCAELCPNGAIRPVTQPKAERAERRQLGPVDPAVEDVDRERG